MNYVYIYNRWQIDIKGNPPQDFQIRHLSDIKRFPIT